jgi:hypothetical protein
MAFISVLSYFFFIVVAFFFVLELYRTRDASRIVFPLLPIDLGKTAHSV